MAAVLFPTGGAAGAGCCASPDVFDWLSDSVCTEPVSSGSPPNSKRYFLAIASQSTTFSIRVPACPAKLNCDPSGDRCTTDNATESVRRKNHFNLVHFHINLNEVNESQNETLSFIQKRDTIDR